MAKQIDKNRYTCVAVDHSILEKSLKADGSEKAESVAVTCRVVEGPNTGLDIYWYGSLHENAQEITAKTLRSMGWTGTDMATLDGLGLMKFIVQGTEDTYNGKTTQRWNVWPLKTPAPRLADENKASFADRFKALAVATPVMEVSSFNKAPDTIPESTSMKNGDNVGGPATSGVPF